MGHSLQATALVNEAYVRLVDGTVVDWHDRAHFLAVAARIYLAPDNRLMAVSIVAAGSTVEPSPPHGLFPLSSPQAYEPSPDGQRFLVARTVSEASPISVILNWKPPGR